MARAVQLGSKADQLAFCRQCRVESAEALELYRQGKQRYMLNDVDCTLSHMESLRRVIRDLDQKIESLKADDQAQAAPRSDPAREADS